jgi:hypothetical protein
MYSLHESPTEETVSTTKLCSKGETMLAPSSPGREVYQTEFNKLVQYERYQSCAFCARKLSVNALKLKGAGRKERLRYAVSTASPWTTKTKFGFRNPSNPTKNTKGNGRGQVGARGQRE